MKRRAMFERDGEAKPRAPLGWVDGVLAVVVGCIAAAATFHLADLTPAFLTRIGGDLWFEADIPRVFDNLTSRFSPQTRASVHPILPLIASLPTILLTKILHSPFHAVLAFMMAVSFATGALLFLCLRLLDLRRHEAAALCALFCASAGFVYFHSVVETFAFGGLTLLAALALAVRPDRTPFALHVAGSALALGVTVTNWIASLASLAVSLPWRRALLGAAAAFFVVAALNAVQSNVFPETGPFMKVLEEKTYVRAPSEHRWRGVLEGLFLHPIVAPHVRVGASGEAQAARPRTIVTAQGASVASDRWGLAAAILWGLLAALGLWGLISQARRRSPFALALGVTILCQAGLHLVYGAETFLYSAHLAPLLVLFGALAFSTPLRRVALVLVLATAVTAGLHNLPERQRARGLLHDLIGETSERGEVLQQMLTRRNDPWSRNTGHAVLGVPGGPLEQKAYVEPGGSLSPAPQTFGVSIWALDPSGGRIATSDDIPSDLLRGGYVAVAGASAPAYRVRAPQYAITWSVDQGGVWTGRLEAQGGARLAVALRSFGPAGGRIDRLTWNGRRLELPGGWTAELGPTPASLHLGDEARDGLAACSSDCGAPGREQTVESASGWAWALLTTGSDRAEIRLTPPRAADASPRPAFDWPVAGLDLPPTFTASLDAQVATLAMGLVGDELRPADPVHYPISWQRDGAYVAVAFARAGQKELARRAALRLARDDFFGGFGSEADAPGYALWSIAAVSSLLDDPQFDALVWPHIVRKVALVEAMLSTKQDLRLPYVGPVVPAYRDRPDLDLVASPARDGLIQGRMDWHKPIFLVNAISMRGLADAAAMAGRLGHADLARRWHDEAAGLRRALALDGSADLLSNPRSLATGLWPTYAIEDRSAFRAALLADWRGDKDPSGEPRHPMPWTYFEIAKLHQWLVLGDLDRLWTGLDWIWSRSPMPGLFTAWEGDGEENDFGRWKAIRGWTAPPFVTPHYWSAAEMLVLQYDMLARLDRSDLAGPGTLVIGGGILPRFLKKPMHAQDLHVAGRLVSWTWDGSRLDVTYTGAPLDVVPGPAFNDKPVTVRRIAAASPGQ